MCPPTHWNSAREHSHRPTRADVADVVAILHAKGHKRETIRKSANYLAAVLDAELVTPNPARSVRLPHEPKRDLVPPLAEHVEAVAAILTGPQRLALLVLDATGVRLGEFDAAHVGDLDEQRHAWLDGGFRMGRAIRWACLDSDTPANQRFLFSDVSPVYAPCDRLRARSSPRSSSNSAFVDRNSSSGRQRPAGAPAIRGLSANVNSSVRRRR